MDNKELFAKKELSETNIVEEKSKQHYTKQSKLMYLILPVIVCFILGVVIYLFDDLNKYINLMVFTMIAGFILIGIYEYIGAKFKYDSTISLIFGAMAILPIIIFLGYLFSLLFVGLF